MHTINEVHELFVQVTFVAPVRRCQRSSHVMRAADTSAQVPITVDKKSKVPLKLEEGDVPLNTFSPKKPFKAKIKSVERIVGPKATGETCHIVIETNGDIPFWEGQSYGVIPPVSLCLHQPGSEHSATQPCLHRNPEIMCNTLKFDSISRAIKSSVRTDGTIT